MPTCTITLLSGSTVCGRECRCDSFRIGCSYNFRRNRGILRYKVQKFPMSGGCICSRLQLYARRGVHFHALARSNPEEAVRVVATAVEFRTGRNDFNLDWTADCAYRKLYQRFSTKCNIVTFRSSCQRSLSFIFLNVADFKGIRRVQDLRVAQTDFET